MGGHGPRRCGRRRWFAGGWLRKKKNGSILAGKGLSGAGTGKYELPKKLRLSFPFCVSYRLQNANAAARAALLMLILIRPIKSGAFPTHFRKKRGNGWGTDAVFRGRINRMSMRRKREMIGKWRRKKLRSAFGPAVPLLPVAIA
jgi:hypothetical protein